MSKKDDLKDLKQDMDDAAEIVRVDETLFSDAIDTLEKSKIRYAEAVIAYYKFKEENNL